MKFTSTILILPGLNNSGDGHWQTIWQNRYGFKRVAQRDWDNPVCDEWINTIDVEVAKHDAANVILVAHSLANTTVAAWARKYKRIIKGALLVAPSDTEAATYPPGTAGFTPMVLDKLPFPSIVIASDDDYYVTLQRAAYFADCWGSTLVNIGSAGHINPSAGFGEWNEGLEHLQKLEAASKQT
ncbi:MAG TPA: alpha/beta hydrolase [Chitinophagaceae bacterium]|nr:alpha/beta hydrolase [Chitinophagaceae bacterium]